MPNEILYITQNDSPIMHFYPIFLILKWSYFLKCPFSINCYADVFFYFWNVDKFKFKFEIVVSVFL